ncbi:MAG: zinc-ribbon domain-containing protein [Proteobacteria bacterium]|nr:zinc-ribbon domain-containing protein [Pseudomonadota bacterium]
MSCPNCKNTLPPGATYCPACGWSQDDEC